MANKNQVTLTFAGDETQLSKAFDNVGQASKRMDDSVGAASKSIRTSGESFDRAGEAADTFDTRSMGARDGITGVQDTMTGFSALAQGDYVNGLLNLGSGFSDIGSSLYNFVIPSIASLSKATIGNAANVVKNTAATVASKTAQVAVAGATKAWTAAQWLMNAALTANPIGLVVAAIALLVTGLVIAYKKSETFRNIVNGAFGAVKNVAVSIFRWIGDNWGKILGFMTAPFSLAIKPIWKHRDSILGAIKAVPGAISGFMKNVASIITAPFRAAFNGVRSAWNNTVGGKGFTVPGWVPEIGGKGFTIPYFHTGGIVPGGLGSESLAVLRAGERVTAGSGSSGGGIVIQSDGSRAGDLLYQLFKETMRVKDGAAFRVVFGG